MRLAIERLPAATIVSVAHRIELEAFHTRKLVLEYGDDGARVVADEALPPTISVPPVRSREHVRPMLRPRPMPEPAVAAVTPPRAPVVIAPAAASPALVPGT